MSNHRSKSVEEFIGEKFDYLITLCRDYAREVCPVFLGKTGEKLHWNFIDPGEVKKKTGRRSKVSER